jgi:hypothetical protein
MTVWFYIQQKRFDSTFAEYVAHNLCCQIRADDISSTCTFTRESQSHAPAHVLMRLYPIDKSLVFCKAKEGRYAFLFCTSFIAINPEIKTADNNCLVLYPTDKF